MTEAVSLAEVKEAEYEGLRKLLQDTEDQITQIKEECDVLTDLLIKKRFRNLAEVRPVHSRERRKKKDILLGNNSAKKQKSNKEESPQKLKDEEDEDDDENSES